MRLCDWPGISFSDMVQINDYFLYRFNFSFTDGGHYEASIDSAEVQLFSCNSIQSFGRMALQIKKFALLSADYDTLIIALPGSLRQARITLMKIIKSKIV